MNPHDMRGLFNDALADSPPQPRAGSTDDIVDAAKRSHRRRRTAQTGAGAVAMVAAVAMLAAVPLTLGWGKQSTTAPPAAGPGSEEPSAEPSDDPADEPSGDPTGPLDDCPEPVGEEGTDEQLAIAFMYGQALDEYVVGIGGDVVNSCFEGVAEHHGFYYDAESGGYRFDEMVYFPEMGAQVRFSVEVHGEDVTTTVYNGEDTPGEVVEQLEEFADVLPAGEEPGNGAEPTEDEETEHSEEPSADEEPTPGNGQG